MSYEFDAYLNQLDVSHSKRGEKLTTILKKQHPENI